MYHEIRYRSRLSDNIVKYCFSSKKNYSIFILLSVLIINAEFPFLHISTAFSYESEHLTIFPYTFSA
jgi:hypothetical protein